MLPDDDSAQLDRFYRAISELNTVVNRGVQLRVLLDTIAMETAQLLGAESVSAALFDDLARYPLTHRTYGLRVLPEALHPRQGALAAWIVENKRPLRLKNAADPRVPRLEAEAEAEGEAVKSVLAVPVLASERVVGMLLAVSLQPKRFRSEQEALLTFLSNSVAGDLDKARRYRMATTDLLTGLYNRQHLAERLNEEVDRAHRYEQPLSALMIDLDHFKAINDAYGPTAGDELLSVVADRMSDVLRDADMLARYRGESFTAVLPNTDRAGAEHAAERLLTLLRETPFARGEQQIAVTGSIGGAVLGPQEEARDLLARVDAALYQAKREGRDRYAFNWLSFAGLS